MRPEADIGAARKRPFKSISTTNEPNGHDVAEFRKYRLQGLKMFRCEISRRIVDARKARPRSRESLDQSSDNRITPDSEDNRDLSCRAFRGAGALVSAAAYANAIRARHLQNRSEERRVGKECR